MHRVVSYRLARAYRNGSAVNVLFKAIVGNGIEEEHLFCLSVIDVELFVERIFYSSRARVVEAEDKLEMASCDVGLYSERLAVNKCQMSKEICGGEVPYAVAYLARVNGEVYALLVSAKPLEKAARKCHLVAERLASHLQLYDEPYSLANYAKSDKIAEREHGEHNESYADVSEHNDQRAKADDQDNAEEYEHKDRNDRR